MTRVKQGGSLITTSIDKELWIDQEDLNNELGDSPLRLRKYTKLKADVHRKLKAIARKLEMARAEAHESYSKEGGRVKDVEHKVETDPAVMKIKEEHDEAEVLFEEYTGIVRAFFARHESIKEICANIRKEMGD